MHPKRVHLRSLPSLSGPTSDPPIFRKKVRPTPVSPEEALRSPEKRPEHRRRAPRFAPHRSGRSGFSTPSPVTGGPPPMPELCSGVTGGGALPSGSPLSWRFSGRIRVLGPGRRSRVCMRDADGQRVVGLAKARWRAHGSSNSTMALVAVHSIKRTPVGTRFAMSSSSDRKMRQQKASCSHGKSSSAHSPPNAPPAAPIALR